MSGCPTFPSPLAVHERALQTVLMRTRPAPLAAALKRAFGIRRRPLETPHGTFWIDPVSSLGADVCSTGAYEPGMRRNIETRLETGGTFVDLGANEGYFTVVAGLRAGPSGRVLAIEPQTRLLPVITENVRLNGLRNVTLLHTAVGDRDGEDEIRLAADTNSGASGLHQSASGMLGRQKVEVRTLASILDREKLDRVDFMKVDIEGGEYEAILGSQEIFKSRRVVHLAMELHPGPLAARGKDAADIIGLLAACGYRMMDIEGHTFWTAAA